MIHVTYRRLKKLETTTPADRAVHAHTDTVDIPPAARQDPVPRVVVGALTSCKGDDEGGAEEAGVRPPGEGRERGCRKTRAVMFCACRRLYFSLVIMFLFL